jgi:hypothetical protein
MTVTTPGIIPDPELSGSGELIGSGGVDAVNSFLRARGWEPGLVKPVQALYTPGRALTVRFVAWGDQKGRQRRFSICAETRQKPPVPVGASSTHGDYLMWEFPHDPRLPHLERAANPETARQIMAGPDSDPGPVSVETIRYRPGRRAVLRYRSLRRRKAPDRELFVKVLDPGVSARSMETAGMITPGPALNLALPHAMPEPGILLTRPIEGTPFRTLLLEGGSLPLPERVAGILDEVAVLTPAPHPLPDPASTLRKTIRLLTTIDPGASPIVTHLQGSVLELLKQHPTTPAVVHGDLYEGQILVGDRFRLGLLDLDDLGYGDPVMDAATATSHLMSLADSHPGSAPLIMAYRRLLRRVLIEKLQTSDRALAGREALVMLSLASGPFRVLDPRWPARVRRRVKLAASLLAA